jgi:hypothetical protein
MLLIALLLTQDPAAEINRLVSGLEALYADSIRNADELDRRYVALSKVLEAKLEDKTRAALLSWMPRLALKTGRPSDGLSLAKLRIKSGGLEPRHLEGAYRDAIYCAALSLKPDEVVTLIRTLAKDYPGSQLGGMREAVEQEVKSLGRPAPSISSPVWDTSKPFPWNAETKDKLVILYFTASW